MRAFSARYHSVASQMIKGLKIARAIVLLHSWNQSSKVPVEVQKCKNTLFIIMCAFI